MCRILIFSTISSFYCLSLFSQDFSGRLIDSITTNPIPFAHIYLRSGLGTISNENGDFTLKAKVDKADTLLISHIGYNREIIPVSKYLKDQVISLKPMAIILKEIVIYDREYTNRLVESIYQQLKKTSQTYFGRAFYRQVTNNNNEPTEIHELFLDISYSSSGIKKYFSKEARFAKKVSTAEKPIISMINQLYLTLGFDLTPEGHREFKKPFNENYKDEISFTITGEYSSKVGNFLLISYSPKDEFTSNGMTGIITVNKKNNCICRYQASTKSSLGMDTLRSKLKSKNSVVLNHLYSWDMGFDCDNEFNPSITYSVVNTSFDTPVYGKIEVNSKLIIYESGDRKFKKSKEFTLEEKDINVIKDTKYHPKFWENNEIIKRTPLEQKIVESFEKSNSFGTYFLNKP